MGVHLLPSRSVYPGWLTFDFCLEWDSSQGRNTNYGLLNRKIKLFAPVKVSLFNRAKKSLFALTDFSLLKHKQHENHQKHLSLSSQNCLYFGQNKSKFHHPWSHSACLSHCVEPLVISACLKGGNTVPWWWTTMFFGFSLYPVLIIYGVRCVSLKLNEWELAAL